MKVKVPNKKPQILRYIKKLTDINCNYSKRNFEITEFTCKISDLKGEIFSKELLGSGTEVIPVWDNIFRLKDILDKFNHCDILNPFMDSNNFNSYNVTVKNSDNKESVLVIDSREKLMKKYFFEYYSVAKKPLEMYPAVLDKEAVLFPNKTITKNLPIVFSWFLKDTHQTIETLSSTIKLYAEYLEDILRRQLDEDTNELVSEEIVFINGLVNKMLLNLSENDKNIPEPPKSDDEGDHVDDVPDDKENSPLDSDLEDDGNKDEEPKDDSTEEVDPSFDDPYMNRILWGLEIITSIYRILNDVIKDSMSLLSLFSDSLCSDEGSEPSEGDSDEPPTDEEDDKFDTDEPPKEEDQPDDEPPSDEEDDKFDIDDKDVKTSKDKKKKEKKIDTDPDSKDNSDEKF